MATLSSHEIAAKFFAQGYRDSWLSVKQTAWLFGTAEREARAEMRASGTTGRIGYTLGGTFGVNGTDYSWTIYRAPNGAGRFQAQPLAVNAERDARKAELDAAISASYETAQRIEDNPELTPEARAFMLDTLRISLDALVRERGMLG